MKMRELEQLSGVGRETIRYYLRIGLLPQPERPKANVAIYGEEHVRRLGAIRRLQAQHYLPLNFIRTVLDRPAHGEASAIPGFESLLLGRLGIATAGPDMPLAAAAQRTGVPVQDLEVLARDGVVAIVDTEAGKALEALDMTIAQTWGRVRAAGFTPETGFFAQDAKIYADTLRALAKVEIDRFFTRVPGGRSVEAAAELGRDGVEIINDFIALLRLKFLLSEIRALPAR